MGLPFLHELETQALTLIKKIAEESEPVTMTQAEIICDHFNLNGEPRKKIISINESLIDVKIDLINNPTSIIIKSSPKYLKLPFFFKINSRLDGNEWSYSSRLERIY